MYFLALSGVANVLLNLFFVIVVDIDVAGVAIGTIASQILSSLMVVICLMRRKDACRLELKKLRIYKQQLITILKIGLPAGLQAILFNVSNVLIQSTVNGFGTTVVAGNTAALNLELFMYTTANCMMQTTVTFCGQNIGARKYSRLGMIVRTCALTVVGLIFIMGGSMLLLRYPLLSLYTKERAVAEVGAMRLMLIIPVYFTCGILETTVGGLRSLGKSMISMLITVVGVCGLRLLVLYAIFPIWPTLETLYISYPASWFITALAQLTALLLVKRKLPADGVEYKL